MPTLREHLNTYNRTRRNVRLIAEDEEHRFKFKRGNLLLHKEARGKEEFYDKWFLILGTVCNIRWDGNETYQYLVKTSNTTRPTLKSKGHYMMTQDLVEVEEDYIISLREAFKDL